MSYKDANEGNKPGFLLYRVPTETRGLQEDKKKVSINSSEPKVTGWGLAHIHPIPSWKPQQLEKKQRKVGRVQKRIASPETPRLHGQPIRPFQPRPLEERRGLA